MAAWQFRCVCCGELRDAPMTRPEGTVYLRCTISRQWAWYEPAAFVLAAPVESALQNGRDRAKAPRAGGGRTRAAARTTPRSVRGRAGRRTRAAAARTTRAASGRKVTRRARRRR